MASETPDPSSSELLTDFDIADVENWDDQNDNSKVGSARRDLEGFRENPDLTEIEKAVQS